MIDINQIPDGTVGPWKIQTFEVPEHSIENIRAMFKPFGRTVKPGKYKRLTRNGSVIMSNTPDEKRDHRSFVNQCSGNILINGLGLGVCLSEVLAKDAVEKVTVVEKSQDVISLVSSFFNDPRLTIICADAFDWKPPRGVRYNAVWHDIWDNICTDNLPEMAKLHRKYGRRTDWQGSWGKGMCQYYKRQEKRRYW